MAETGSEEPEASYDAVVIGTGSGGKLAAIELARLGHSVLAVEAGRFGGECPYVACVPAKSMLLSARAGLTWAEAVTRRDEATAGRDDSGSLKSLTDEGVAVLRGRARLVADPGGDGRPGHRLVVDRGGHGTVELAAPVVVLGSGSSPSRPPLEGLDGVPTWTSDEALSADEQPARVVILGGGAVGCELAQAFVLLGTGVVMVEVAERLLPAETVWVGRLLAEQLRADGVDVRVGASAQRVEATDSGRALRLHLEGGEEVEADRMLVCGGRSPNTSGLGLDLVGGRLEKSGAVSVDGRCRVLRPDGEPIAGLYAVGDVTEVSSYTHSANYQARIIAADVAGRGYDADYSAIPRAVYVHPAVFCVGLTEEQAVERGIDVRTASFAVADVERATLWGHAVPPPGRREVRGRVELVADATSGVVLGASCVGPEADSWGAELALAVRARLDVHLLSEHVRAFPTWSEAIYPPACTLDEEIAGRP
jgi:pyruvate/2-oxoglutarate dehydrogenase complex dihydrolipoamide dehydrogenase (E3) component